MAMDHSEDLKALFGDPAKGMRKDLRLDYELMGVGGDVAWMVTFALMLGEMFNDRGLCSWITWDSSPQGGRDLEVVVFECVATSSLGRLYRDIKALEQRLCVVCLLFVVVCWWSWW